MKPRLFIGSSTEDLQIADAIQENLQYDAEVTIWNQGVFQLSSNTLTDLLVKIETTDYAVFVCNPTDLSIIREEKAKTIRDNVIFELGLFIGKLGREKVFYLIPKDDKMHIPTDLFGVTPGKYDHMRNDRNWNAAVGPFCSQIKKELLKFKYNNLGELESENAEVKRLAIERPYGFEYLMLAEMIDSRLRISEKRGQALKQGSKFVKTTQKNVDEYFAWMREVIEDFSRFTEVLEKLINQDIKKALGEAGVASKFPDLIEVSDLFSNLSDELVNWEVANEQILPPDELKKVKTLLRGSSESFLQHLRQLPLAIRQLIEDSNPDLSPSEKQKIVMTLDFPPQIGEALGIFQKYFNNKLNQ